MKPIEERSAPSDLHALYCSLTQLDLTHIPVIHDYDWWAWNQHFSAEDLRLVVPWLRKRYGDQKAILRSMLMFRHLIRGIDNFAEYLAEARRDAGLKLSARQKVLQVTGRTETKVDNVKTPADILRSGGLKTDPLRPSTSPINPNATAPLPSEWQNLLNALKEKMRWKD